MITIDGSYGEGGGQILRTSLALSLLTGQPFRIINIRAGRRNPGLLRQHLTAVSAAIEVGNADVTGAAIGAKEMVFSPKTVRAGNYSFAIGTAGSTTLVLQTVLPALLTASASSSLTLEGGTHNPFAPPFDFLTRAFLPLIKRMGAEIEGTLHRHGFYPAGGGKLQFTINPVAKLKPLDLRESGKVTRRGARALVSNLPESVGARELATLARKLSWSAESLTTEVIKDSHGPGNVLIVELEYENVTEVFTGFGERGVTSESVAGETAKAVRRYLAAGAPVGEYLADQLLIPLVMAGRGSFVTMPLSRHSTTNIEVIRKFLDTPIQVSEVEGRRFLVEVGS